MKKSAYIFSFFLLSSFAFSTLGHAGIWETEQVVFCVKSVEYNGLPVTVRGAKIECIPESMSLCLYTKCKEITRPIQ